MIKRIVIDADNMAYFNPRLYTELTVDDSLVGLGAILANMNKETTSESLMPVTA